MKKTNPKKIPKTQADCKKAFETGVNAGVFNASAIFLTVLLDHYGFEGRINEVWNDVVKLSEEIGEGRVRISDLKKVLLDEYRIRV